MKTVYSKCNIKATFSFTDDGKLILSASSPGNTVQFEGEVPKLFVNEYLVVLSAMSGGRVAFMLEDGSFPESRLAEIPQLENIVEKQEAGLDELRVTLDSQLGMIKEKDKSLDEKERGLEALRKVIEENAAEITKLREENTELQKRLPSEVQVTDELGTPEKIA